MKKLHYSQTLLLLTTLSISVAWTTAQAQSGPMVDRISELRKKADTNWDGQISETERTAMAARLKAAKSGGLPTGPNGGPGIGNRPQGKPSPFKPRDPKSPARPGSAPFQDGASCLFIGHSFFVPVAKSFNDIATATGFPDHQMQAVFAGGQAGSPGQLWNHPTRKDQIESILANGDVELLGMPVNGQQEDYQRWIDLALQYNPKTQFMIGQFWMVAGPQLDDERYAQATESMTDRVFPIVEDLRKHNSSPIHYVNYGQVASDMKIAFSADQLPDITEMVGPGREALYRDAKMGHAGPLMQELCALTWIATLYGAGVDDVQHSDFSKEATAIVRKANRENLALHQRLGT